MAAKGKPVRPVPPKRKPLTASQIAERAKKLQADAEKWWGRLARAFRALDKNRAAFARLKRLHAKRNGDQ